jgi:hypothetical protein
MKQPTPSPDPGIPNKLPAPPPPLSSLEVEKISSASSTNSSRTLSLESEDNLITIRSDDNNKNEQSSLQGGNEYDAATLAQYTQDMLTATHCSFDLSGEELSGEESTVHKKRRIIPKQSRQTEKDVEETGYGNLPLIDMWVAQAKGLTREEVKAMLNSAKDDEACIDRKGDELIVQATCGAWAGCVIRDDHETRYVAMPLPNEDDLDS